MSESFSGKDKVPTTLTRREFLRRGAILAGEVSFAALANRSEFPLWFWPKVMESAIAYPWKERREVIYHQDRLFVSTNPKLATESASQKFAYVITHAGYTEYMLWDFIKYIEQSGERWIPDVRPEYESMRAMANKITGDYQDYTSSLTRLINALKVSNTTTIFAVEERDFYHPELPRPELRPFDKAFLVVTSNASPSFIDKVETLEGERIQQPDLMFEYLRNLGVEEVRMAGEWSVGPFGLACLGGMVDSFLKQGFTIRGIQDCVFPSLRPKKGDPVILERLYEDTVSLKEI